MKIPYTFLGSICLEEVRKIRALWKYLLKALKALANRANMLANIWTNIVGQYVGQHVGAVCNRHEHVGEEKKRGKMFVKIY